MPRHARGGAEDNLCKCLYCIYPFMHPISTVDSVWVIDAVEVVASVA